VSGQSASSSVPDQTTSSSVSGDREFASQPQVEDLPKHSKSMADDTAASPPKARITAIVS